MASKPGLFPTAKANEAEVARRARRTVEAAIERRFAPKREAVTSALDAMGAFTDRDATAALVMAGIMDGVVGQSAERDAAGGRWTLVAHPDHRGWEIGLYLDSDGNVAGFRMAPYGEFAGSPIPTPAPLLTTYLRTVKIDQEILPQVLRAASALAAFEASDAQSVIVMRGPSDWFPSAQRRLGTVGATHVHRGQRSEHVILRGQRIRRPLGHTATQIRIGERTAGRIVRVTPLIPGAGPGSAGAAEAAERSLAIGPRRRPRRKKGSLSINPPPDIDSLIVAVHYAHANRFGPRPVNQHIAQQFGRLRGDSGAKWANRMIACARDDKWLPPGLGKGKSTGDTLMPSALAVLQSLAHALHLRGGGSALKPKMTLPEWITPSLARSTFKALIELQVIATASSQ